MLKQGLILLAFTGSVLSGIASASEHAYPRTHAIQSLDGTHVIGWHLMTEDEKKEYREKMESAQTNEDREQILQKNHSKMKARAKERGVPLRKMPPGQKELMEDDHQHTMDNEMDDHQMSPQNEHHEGMEGHKMH
ncbi:hypothetical protein [Thiomicrorhabdus arctica]|uniref:hypothetical protein n=1 Tax=Thiomicrorhabdus arctica TaxID=131540 RepID=UPI00037767F1|nr:hypothetical protein [Thiomicrorhabdus arctica]